MNTSCSFLGVYIDSTDSFKKQLIALATIYATMCLPTTILNFLIWTTVVAKRHLQHPVYIIIANLAITDWLAGCLIFPSYAAVCIMQSMGKDPCKIVIVATPTSFMLGTTTFLVISFQAVERYIAIFYPFQYKIRFTNSVIIITNVIIWIISCTSVLYWVLSRNTLMFNIFIVVLIFTFSSVDMFCYFKIYVQIKRIEKQIGIQAKISTEANTSRPKSESKVARVTAAILLTVLICYTPLFGCFLYASFTGEKSRESHYFLYWSALLALLNSFMNPVISCMQLSVIRKAVFWRDSSTNTSVIQVGTHKTFSARFKRKDTHTD